MTSANGKMAATFWIAILVGCCTIASFVVGRISAIEEKAAASQRVQDRISELEEDAGLLQKNAAVTEDAIKSNLNGVILQQREIANRQQEIDRKMIHFVDEVTKSNAQSIELARVNERLRSLSSRVDTLNGNVVELSSVVEQHSEVVQTLTKRIKKKLGDASP